MQIIDSIGSSLQTIFAHKMRSFLTMLGMMIGVISVVTMFAMVDSFKTIMKKNLEGMGWNNSIIIQPSDGWSPKGRKRHNFYYVNRRSKSLTLQDVEAIRKELDLDILYGVIEKWMNEYLNGEHISFKAKAINNDFFKSKTYTVKEGRIFNQFEIKNRAHVCVIGSGFFEDNFDNDKTIIGEFLTLNGFRFKIIGVVEDGLDNGKLDFNKWERKWELKNVFIPVTTGASYFKGRNTIDYIFSNVNSESEYETTKNRINQILLREHNMGHDFKFEDIGAEVSKVLKEIKDMLRRWNITLSVIASISLIVGGIGLFSTLLISITERMTEIGIRKSIGAQNLDIFFYFLIEAIMIAVIGALLGILISKFILFGATKLLEFKVALPWKGVFVGIGFSTAVGVISGIYPAIKASKIDPIKAIFYYD
ncbi:MAG: ABC transporter permease [Candidatus Cloacimonadota bacterium]|nr:ABC transporter permease [Candidatus Cloacimonadota bacterium]